MRCTDVPSTDSNEVYRRCGSPWLIVNVGVTGVVIRSFRIKWLPQGKASGTFNLGVRGWVALWNCLPQVISRLFPATRFPVHCSLIFQTSEAIFSVTVSAFKQTVNPQPLTTRRHIPLGRCVGVHNCDSLKLHVLFSSLSLQSVSQQNFYFYHRFNVRNDMDSMLIIPGRKLSA
jgi:hypothetical protein